MKEIDRIKKTSIWIFIIPFVTLNLCLFISVNYHLLENTIFTVDQIGRSGFTIPYIDGSLSISRSARTYPTYLLFKPGMIITAILLIQYWLANNKLFQKINENTKKNKYFLFFGIGSALFLISHSIFLGFDFEIELYKFFRKRKNFQWMSKKKLRKNLNLNHAYFTSFGFWMFNHAKF